MEGKIERNVPKVIEALSKDGSSGQHIEASKVDISSVDSSSSLANYIGTDSFARLQNLKLLKLNYMSLSEHYKEFPRRLRWLSWRNCSLRSIPGDFPLENIVVIDIRYNSLKQLWKGVKFLGSLKILNLSHSWELKKIPDLSRLPKYREVDP